MLIFPSFLIIKIKRRRRATCVPASNNPTTDINTVLHSNTSAAISNGEIDLFMPFLIHLYFTLVDHYC
ncbi:hypothetical protein NC652_033724 [Populus alba x Populus x berolinensis]|nr:hypothetical protein NC652_033724 [Populus alba x Populus x berolinensis]